MSDQLFLTNFLFKLAKDTSQLLCNSQLEEMTERNNMALLAAQESQQSAWGVPPPALAALLAHVSSGTSTRSVSPVDR